MATTSSTLFNGNSRYSTDFQAVVTRAVAIASLPLNQMQVQKTRLDAETTSLASLNTKMSAVQTAISNLQIGTGFASFQTTISDPTIVSASLSTGVTDATYSLNVMKLGAFTNTMGSAPGVNVSTATVADPTTQNIVAASNFTLTIGATKTYAIAPSGAGLNDLVDAINTTAGSDVTASVVSVNGQSALSIRTNTVSGGSIGLTYTDGGGLEQPIPMSAATSLVTDPTKQTVATPGSGSFTLQLNGATAYTIRPTGNTLTGLVDAINQTAGADVHASIVNIGSSGTPDYRLSVQMNKLASTTVQLGYTDGNGNAQSVLDQLTVGSAAQYTVNGSASVSTSDSRNITLAPGLSATLLKESGTGGPTTIAIARSGASISNALSSFAGAYNAAMAELNIHRGKNGGVLAGQGIISDLGSTLGNLAGYSAGNKGLSSLAAIGMTFTSSGQLSFDSAAFTTATSTTSTSFSDLINFLGQPTTGGFLKVATDAINGVEGTGGVVQSAITSNQDEVARQNSKISDEQGRIDTLTKTLQSRMAAADALVANLEQQATYMSNLFSAMTSASNSLR